MKERAELESCWLVHAASTSSNVGHRCAILTSRARSRPSIAAPLPSAPRGDRNGEDDTKDDDDDDDDDE
jgi:hypothetical protein